MLINVCTCNMGIGGIIKESLQGLRHLANTMVIISTNNHFLKVTMKSMFL